MAPPIICKKTKNLKASTTPNPLVKTHQVARVNPCKFLHQQQNLYSKLSQPKNTKSKSLHL